MSRRLRWLLCAGALCAAGVIVFVARPAHSDRSGGVKGQVAIKDRKDASGVVVTIEGVQDGEPDPAREREVRQKNRQFAPFLTVVPKGSSVAFPNDDKIHHNVFSVSKAKRFDLGLYKSGDTKSVTFNREGVVDVYCNIHPEMVAKVKVVDTRYYAVTGKDGRFRIDNVPAGNYPIVAWQAYGEEYRGTVDIQPGRTATVKIDLETGRKPRSHPRKDGTPYGRYK